MIIKSNPGLINFCKRIIFIILLFLVVAVPLVFSHSTTEVWGLIKIILTEVLVLLMLGFWLIRLNEQGRWRLSLTAAGIPVILFFLCASISLICAVNIWEGLLDLCQLASYVALFFIILNNIRSKREVSLILSGMVLAAFISCVYSIFQDQGPYILTSLRQTYLSTFGHPVFFAQYLVAVFPVSVVVFLHARAWWAKLAAGFAVVSIFIFLLLVKSRGAWAGLIIAGLVILFIRIIQRRRRREKSISTFNRKNLIILLVCLMLFISGLSLFSSARVWHKGIIERMYSTFNLSYVTNAMRLHVWRNTLHMIKDHPFLGVGLGNYRIVYPSYRSLEELSITPEGKRYSKAHNDYLQILAETGIVGIVSFLWIIIVVSCMCLRVIMDKKDSFYSLMITGIFAGMLATLVHAFFSSNLRIPSSAMTFWLFLGIIGAVYKKVYNDADLTSDRFGNITPWRYYSVLSLVPILVVFLSFQLIKPLIADVYFKKAQLYKNKKRPLEAVSLFEKSLSYYSGNFETYFLCGRTYQEMKMPPEAFVYYEQAVKLHPYQPLIYNNLGTVYFENESYKKAISAFKKAVEINPRYFGAHYNLYLVYNRIGEKNKARGHLNLIMELKPDFLGNIHFEQKQYDLAIQAYRRVVEQDPDNVEAHFNLGLAYQAQHLDQKAIEEFRRVIKLRPDYLGAYRNLGPLLFKQENKGAYRDAAGVYKNLLKLVPADIKAHYNLGIIYTEIGEYAQAKREFEEIINLNPRYLVAYAAIAKIYRKQGKLDEAIKVLKDALAINPDFKEAKDFLQSIYKQKLQE